MKSTLDVLQSVVNVMWNLMNNFWFALYGLAPLVGINLKLAYVNMVRHGDPGYIIYASIASMVMVGLFLHGFRNNVLSVMNPFVFMANGAGAIALAVIGFAIWTLQWPTWYIDVNFFVKTGMTIYFAIGFLCLMIHFFYGAEPPEWMRRAATKVALKIGLLKSSA
jgi:hypothetical protein